jgi:hypothetical protein
MAKAKQAFGYRGEQIRPKKSYSSKISDHVAIALMVYTLLAIFVVAPAIEGKGAAIWPYFFLVVLVAAAIPPFRRIDERWQMLSKSELSNSGLETRYTIDRIKLWIIAIGVPFALAAVFRAVAAAV